MRLHRFFTPSSCFAPGPPRPDSSSEIRDELIDFVAIIPFYIDVAARGSNIPGLSVLRVLRLARLSLLNSKIQSRLGRR